MEWTYSVSIRFLLNTLCSLSKGTGDIINPVLSSNSIWALSFIPETALFLHLAPLKFSCHPSLHPLFFGSVQGVLVLSAPGEELGPEQPNAAAELLIRLLRCVHTTTTNDTPQRHMGGLNQVCQEMLAARLVCADRRSPFVSSTRLVELPSPLQSSARLFSFDLCKTAAQKLRH